MSNKVFTVGRRGFLAGAAAAKAVKEGLAAADVYPGFVSAV